MSRGIFTFISDKIAEAFSWQEELKTVQWCKDNIYLNQDVTPHTGMISFEKTPWIEQILNDWDKPHVEQFNIMASTQVGKTTIEFCCISKELDTDPCMMQLTIPTDDGVGDFVKTKFDPFFRGIKSLQTKMSLYKTEEKLRQKGAIKEVTNGMLFILGNTDKNRRSKTVKNIFIDEAALFGKGHIKELIGRTKFFEKTGRKIFIVSSRKHKGDEIEIAYENSYCKKELQILCRGCNEYFYPTGSKQFKWMTEVEYRSKYGIETIENLNDYKREAKETAHVLCDCGHKTTSIDIEDLIREKKVNLVTVEGDEADTIYGYKLNALATGLTKYSTIAESLIEAGGDPQELQTIYQDYFNETYEFVFVEKEQSDMFLLGNGLKEWQVPKNTYKIYMGVDTQRDHFWVEVKAYCYGSIVHTIYASRVETFAEIEDIWQEGQYLLDEDGNMQMIAKMGIDRRGYNQSGARRTDEVDEFVAYMVKKYKNGDENRIYATEGHPSLAGDKPFSIVNTKDYSNNRNKLDIKIVKTSNIYLKNSINLKMQRAIAKAKAESESDEGFSYEAKLFYINQDIIDADMKATVSTSYTRQINAEVYDYGINPKTGKVDAEKSWINPKQADNHFFDTSVICEAFAEIDKVSLQRKTESNGIAKALGSLSSL
ncbi:MAG: hypothetical protein QG567_2491 [Campylobacterota bacterium]|nr:hypothetical protein [Campylobacterota bacterium]